ncbi:MAG: urease accessory protein UreE [Streptococcus sp.]|nr:urease accessory protein UreE [Streptococcus sp.]
MIFTKIDTYVKDLDLDAYHVETAILSSDDLNKKIIRVSSDHGNEFGIRLDKGQQLENGAAFFIDDHHVLAIGVESQHLIVISPKDMDEMGTTAHILGNTHKPVVVKDAKIYLEVDPVVEQVLTQKNIAYTIEEIILDKPLRHVNLTAHEH